MGRPARSRRLGQLVQSDIRRMTRECERVGGYNLGQGICDLPTPSLVRDGAIAAITEGRSTYSFMEGAPELRAAIARKLARDNGLRVDPEREVMVTVGSSAAFTAALYALLDPGDGIVLFEPYYGYHLNAALIAGVEAHFVELRPPEFAITEAALRSALRPNTRAVVLCTPANPSGKMLSLEEIHAIGRVAREHDLLLITDEIYEYIRYDGRPHISPASVDDMGQRTVTIMGVSKTFSITGWRIGYAVAPPEMIEAMVVVHDIHNVCAPTPLQLGAAAGFAAPKSFFDGLQSDYQRKRDQICAALESAGMPPIVPQGAYYVLADIGRLGFPDARSAAMALLQEAKVASIPGTSFYRGAVGERLLRFCFAKEDSVLDGACAALRRWRA